MLLYCEAIFVDSELRALLDFDPVRERLGFEIEVIIRSTVGDPVDFLDELERSASGDAIATAVGLYGVQRHA